jgi:hypothetical protein
MLKQRPQPGLDVLEAPTTDAGVSRMPLGPLRLHDRTVWWTGRVAIGLTHGCNDPAIAVPAATIVQPAPAGCSETTCRPCDTLRGQCWRQRLRKLLDVIVVAMSARRAPRWP